MNMQMVCRTQRKHTVCW